MRAPLTPHQAAEYLRDMRDQAAYGACDTLPVGAVQIATPDEVETLMATCRAMLYPAGADQ